MLTLVTVIYGTDPRYRIELFGSVLSALKLRQDPATSIVVYTDRALDGFPLPVTQRIISAAEWQDWTRGSGLTHLVKLHLIRETLEASGQPVIYFDTDTLFLTPPEQLASRLSPTSVLMHDAEGPISGHAVWSRIAAWLGSGREVSGVLLSRQSVMHNSGIVGVLPEHREALQRSVSIADTLYAIDTVFSLDQFATGNSLGQDARILTCPHDVLHYWGWNRGFIRSAIDRFWQNHRTLDPVQLAADFDPTTYPQLPLIHWQDKLEARYLGVKWRMDDDSRFACIALKSALRHCSKDIEVANQWFAVHLEFLHKPRSDSGAVERLRTGLVRHYLACWPWLSPANAAALKVWLGVSATGSGGVSP